MTKLPEGRWHHFQADLFRPIPSQEYVLVVQCLYLQYSAVEIINSTSAEAVILAMVQIPYRLWHNNQTGNRQWPTIFRTPISPGKSHHTHHGLTTQLNTLCGTSVKFYEQPNMKIGTGEQLHWL